MQFIKSVVFARGPSGGNDCPIVVDADALSSAEMQALAAQFGQETAFVLPSTDPDAVFRVRYFVPNYEMSMCVHATVGVAMWLYTTNQVKETFWLQTPLGKRWINMQQRDERWIAWVEQGQPSMVLDALRKEDVASALGIDAREIDPHYPIETWSTSRPKTMVPLIREDALKNLKPNFEALWDLLEDHQSTGFYPFVKHREEKNLWIARQFPWRVGYPEDPATGVAASALSCYLSRHQKEQSTLPSRQVFHIFQGDAMGRPSELWAMVQLGSRGEVISSAVGGSALILTN